MGIIADLFQKPKYGIIFTGLGIDKIHKTQYDTKVAAHFSAIKLFEYGERETFRIIKFKIVN